MIGYYCQIQTYDGNKQKFSRLAKIIRKWIENERPLCYDCRYVEYVSDTKSYKVVRTLRYVPDKELFPKLISHDNILKFIEYAKNSKSTKIDDIIVGTEFTNDYAYRIRSELNRIHLLKSFIPELPVCDIDFDKIGIWEQYGYSENWYIYYRSDNFKKKFESKGLNFDELYDDPDTE